MTLLVFLFSLGWTLVASTGGETALTNITRFNVAGGDLFSIPGADCGPTTCMEVSHGTALSTMGAGGDCVCQCHIDTPAFREDQKVCVNHIDECQMASFGRGATKPQIPFVFLPLKGQIIYPSKEIVFSDVDDAICVVTSAQYLTPTGWMTLRDVIDNDVPFGLYRDEGKTFLQWRGSAILHSRLEGRLVAAHVLCSAQNPARLASSCAAFRVAGTSRNALLDVRSIPFHAGEIVSPEASTQAQGLSVLECLAIGVCVLLLIFVYAAGIVFYIHYKQRQKRKDKDPEMNRSNTMSTENGSVMEPRIDMDNVHMKTNPLLSMEGDFMHDAGLSDVSERTEETMDSTPSNKTQKKLNSNVISALVHSKKKKQARPSIRSPTNSERMAERLQRRSASPDTFERAPHSDLSIVDCSVEGTTNFQSHQSNSDPALRRKLYFNPVFFETEHLKNPPPAAIDFLVKIREVMSIAKEKMTSKRFIPILTNIPEEELYHTIDLGWDIPCARRGRRFSAISLKRENSRRSVHCGGCPGCDNSSVKETPKVALVRSNSCKTCVSEDYKQTIVRKWLDEVPTPTSITRPVKVVAKVSGTPRVVEPKKQENIPVPPPEPVLPPEPTRDMSSLEKKKTSKTLRNYSSLEKKTHFKSLRNDYSLEKKKETKLTEPVTKEALKRTFAEHKKNDIKVMKNEPTEDKPQRPEIIHTSLNNKPLSPVPNINHATRRVRKKLPPPPPPPVDLVPSPTESQQEEAEIVLPEVKMKMEAVIKELNNCRRSEPITLEEVKTEMVTSIAPKIVIPVLAPDSQYYSDDNILADRYKHRNHHFVDLDSLERNILKRRRFSVACGPEVGRSEFTQRPLMIQKNCENFSRSWRDVRTAVDGYQLITSTQGSTDNSDFENRSMPISEIFINNTLAQEPLYNNVNDIIKPGPLTIQVRGSPVESRRNTEQFDPDTLDRKPKDINKRVDKIVLKSGGSFKYKSATGDENNHMSPPETTFTRKIGSLREIYEAKAKAQEEEIRYNKGIYERRASSIISYDSDDLAAFIRSVKTPDLLRQTETERVLKPPIPPKQRRASDVCYTNIASMTRQSPPGDVRRRSPEESDRFTQYNRSDNLSARRSGRRSARTRSRRTDLKKLTRPEDSGYLSTDSNESRRRANYLMQLKPRMNFGMDAINMLPHITNMQKMIPPFIQIESDTDELESICDGRSESGGESVETDSVFFGNFDESKQMMADLDLSNFEPQTKIMLEDQIDSGFAGETNIILSGDSDSEHRSVISIVAGCDGRASSASIGKLDENPYLHSVEC